MVIKVFLKDYKQDLIARLWLEENVGPIVNIDTPMGFGIWKSDINAWYTTYTQRSEFDSYYTRAFVFNNEANALSFILKFDAMILKEYD